MGNTVTTSDDLLSFEYLAKRIIDIQDLLLSRAAHAVNLSLTARNWIVGYYIVEYEQKGSDRAQYGEALLKRLASRINKRGLGERRLYEFRQMYLVYPYLGTEIIPYILKDNDQILRLPTAKSEQSFLKEEILRLPTAISPSLELEKWQNRLQLPSEEDIKSYLLQYISEKDFINDKEK